MRTITAIFIGISLMLSGCATFGTLPSVCDTHLADSRLCQAAQAESVRLEDVGNAMTIANAIAIGEGLYTKADAIRIYNRAIQVVTDPTVTYTVLVRFLGDTEAKYPGVATVVASYLNAFVNTDTLITAYDRNLMAVWFSRQVELLER